MSVVLQNATGCLVCGEELTYRDNPETRTCFYCGVDKDTNACCGSGHYVCDACHNGSANDLIERHCRNTASVSPMSLAMTLMKNPLLKMHGPEHHFLVPAVLVACFFNHKGSEGELLGEKLEQARKRADDVKGGFCGFCGACGAAIGAGIFLSVVTGATPLSDSERKKSNMITAECLRVIAENAGPRCCKRETYWSIITAVKFIARELDLILPLEVPECPFSNFNRECLEERCRFFPKAER